MHRTFTASIFVIAMLALVASSASPLSAAQDNGGAAPEPVIVTFASADESTFRAVLALPADITAVEAALAGDGYAGIPNGVLAHGDGGINAPHDWHMVDTQLADFTIEVCDGTATMVDDDVAYWVDTVGQFCPWSATVFDVESVNGTNPGGGLITQLVALLIAALMAILADLSPQAP